MPSPFILHNTLGAMFIGMVLSTSLHGIGIIQSWYYYTNQSDKWPLKSLVAAVLVCDTVHQVMVVYSVYFYAITNWGNPDQLDHIVRSLGVEVLFNALTALLVQSFLTLRVWRFGKHNFLAAITALVVLAEFATSLAFITLVLQLETFAQLGGLKSLSLTVMALTAVGDLLIAGALCTLLHMSRTGVHRSDTMINKLIMFAVNTGLLTSLFAVASFISYVAAPNTFIYVAFYFCIGGLYTNALLANLNVRKTICDSLEATAGTNTNVALSLRELSKDRSTSRRCASRISFKFDTANEIVTDLTTDDQSGRDDYKQIEYLQKSTSSAAVGFEEEQ